MSHHTPLAYAPCRVPLRRAIGVFGGINITAHAGIYHDIFEADRRWKAAGGAALWDVRQSDTGSYNCRNSVAHSRGVAIDFNWSTNGMTSKRTPCPGDMPAAFYDICWKPLGYGWGANWRSKCDRMHISKLISEGGDGVLYRTWENEEDDLPDITEVRKAVDDALDARFGARPDYAGDDPLEKALYRGFKDASGAWVFSEEVHDAFLMLVELCKKNGIDPATVVKMPA